ncbi:Uma2 family endonuclease [Streptomyces sp. DSM 40750]|nr:Uma2 family endonuclease [Streptomyces sp. DSM 40750]
MLYLLIDRDDCTVTVFTEPEDGRYRQQVNKTSSHLVSLCDDSSASGKS